MSINSSKEDIYFQIIDWESFDISEDFESENSEENEDYNKQYRIDLFGRTKENKTIHVEVKNFTPYFFVEIPEYWKSSHVTKFIRVLEKKVWSKFKDSLVSYKVVSKCKFESFTDYKKFPFIQLIFKNYAGYRAYERVFSRKIFDTVLIPRGRKFKLFESNIEPFLRCMHIRNLDACGWVKISKENYNFDKTKPSRCDIDIITKWTSLEKYECSDSMPFVIASFDIECTSGDGKFPQANREEDKVIQIGTTFNKYGEDECFYKHMITLGTCEPIEGVDVESYETEKEVLLAWTKMIQRMDPDIMTGYFIFGFDYNYLYERSKFLDIEHRFSQLGRLKHMETKFITKDLSSSALGENILKFYKTIGRIQVDLMKVVQKDYKLSSFKLDFVSSHFIRENIDKIDNIRTKTKFNVINQIFDDYYSIIHTKSIYGLKEGQFITINYHTGLDDNKFNDGEKYRIVKLEPNKIYVLGIIEGEELTKYKSYWCQAKDDLPPRELFKLQEGSSKDRCTIARYCIQDCVLVNKLMAKLQVVTNNIGMANVCSVPLSYLFLRGQGVKIYSLVSKMCRLKNHLIPTAVRKNNIDEKKLKTFILNIVKVVLNKFNPDKKIMDFKLRRTVNKIIRFVIEKLFSINYIIDKLREKKVYKDKKPDDLTLEDTKKHVEKIFNDADFNENLKNYDFNRTDIKSEINYNLIQEFIDENIIEEDCDVFGKLKGKEEDKKKNSKYDMEDALKELGINENESYEGATVFDPDTGVHFDPIPVLDYASLYPRSMIHRNLSHECFVDNDNFRNLKNYIYRDVWYRSGDGSMTKATFAQKKDGSLGILPQILQFLLDARSRTKKERDAETDPFKKDVKEGLQLAYKITANSLYGQTGANTSPIKMKAIAACTTATGREMLTYAKEFNESVFPYMINLIQKGKIEKYKKKMNKLFDGKLLKFDMSDDFRELLTKAPDLVVKVDNERFNEKKQPYKTREEFIDYFENRIKEILKENTVEPKVIYGDTDSVFLNFFIKDKDGNNLQNHEALKMAIDLGVLCGLFINKVMPFPHDLEYEKTFWPFVILTKKRYVGNLYEYNPDKFKQKSMGIVLKRRDNAPIVKIVCGSVVNSILVDKSAKKAVELTQKCLDDILSEKYPIEKFIITKTLKSTYKNRQSIMHAVLADRMGARDPGNKPQSNDRIPFAFIRTDHLTKKKLLKGECIEHPDYIKENNLKLDYLLYITDQIMKPTVQFLSLLVKNPEDIFNKFIIIEKNRRKGQKPIHSFFDKVKDDNIEDKLNVFSIVDNNQLKKKTKNVVKKIKKNKKTPKEYKPKITKNGIEIGDLFL